MSTATRDRPTLGSKEEIAKSIKIDTTDMQWRFFNIDTRGLQWRYIERDKSLEKVEPYDGRGFKLPYLVGITARLGSIAKCEAMLIKRELVDWVERPVDSDTDTDDETDCGPYYRPLELADGDNLEKFGDEILNDCTADFNLGLASALYDKCRSVKPRWMALCDKMDLDRLRTQLKQWESTFAEAHDGAKPARDDIKSNRSIAELYKEYHALKKPTAKTRSKPAAEPKNKKRKAKDKNDPAHSAKRSRHKDSSSDDECEPRKPAPSPDQVRANRAWLLLFTKIVVDDSKQRQGIGTMLVQAIMQDVIAKARDKKRIVLAFTEPRSLLLSPPEDDIPPDSDSDSDSDDEFPRVDTSSRERQRLLEWRLFKTLFMEKTVADEHRERAVQFWKSMGFERVEPDEWYLEYDGLKPPSSFFIWSPALERAPSLFTRGSTFSTSDKGAVIVE